MRNAATYRTKFASKLCKCYGKQPEWFWTFLIFLNCKSRSEFAEFAIGRYKIAVLLALLAFRTPKTWVSRKVSKFFQKIAIWGALNSAILFKFFNFFFNFFRLDALIWNDKLLIRLPGGHAS